MPFLFLACAVLLILNPIWNPGRLFLRQKRMGRGCQPLYTIKFRSMRNIGKITRGAEDPIEQERITPLGHLIRECRVDELPQIINVLLGQMSLIGPRPDCYAHALVFLETVPGYRTRHVVRPGISGLAQVKVGYVEGSEATKAKVAADLWYLEHAGFILDTQIALLTVWTVVRLMGA